jgi:hypothetical protein
MHNTRRPIEALNCIALSAITFTGLLGTISSAHAYVYSSEAQYASWSQGAWSISNLVWGNTTDPNTSQWLNVTSITDWNVESNQTGSGIKSYPNIDVVPNTELSSMKSAGATFSVSNPSSGYIASWFFDVYSNNWGEDQLQVYESWTSGTGGWGDEIASNVTIGDSTYSQIWQASYASSSGTCNVLMFFRNSQRTSGTENLLAIENWAKSAGVLKNDNFYSMSFGNEITSTNGWQYFYCNSYVGSWANTSGGGSSN